MRPSDFYGKAIIEWLANSPGPTIQILDPMKVFLFTSLLFGLLMPMSAAPPEPQFNGRWRLDAERSSALDGWTAMDLVLKIEGSRIAIEHDMRWRSTRVVATNSIDTSQDQYVTNFFRIEQRHMAVYPPKKSETPVSAEWLDAGRTLRVQALVPVEVSQGDATIRMYYEYRLGAGNDTLTLIELHSTRNNPLVYRFRKLSADDSSRP